MPVTAALRFDPDLPAVVLLDQTRLPLEERELVCTDVPTLIDAIKRLVVRGAPLLGVAGGYGIALAAIQRSDVHRAADELSAARPTAVNLGWAVRRVMRAYDEGGVDGAIAEARAIEAEDAAASVAMAEHGLSLVPSGARILTHCNTGSLVSAGAGTAFGLIEAAHRAGRVACLWVCETRPLLQGARLTAYEAARAGIPHRVLVDSAAGVLMSRGEVDLVVVGADRIAADGSVANKVGTLAHAVLARHFGVPFVVVAPTSTIDLSTPGAHDIVVEERSGSEVTSYDGHRIAPAGSEAFNPAFDVTPPRLVTALVTEVGVAQPVDKTTVARTAHNRRAGATIDP